MPLYVVDWSYERPVALVCDSNRIFPTNKNVQIVCFVWKRCYVILKLDFLESMFLVLRTRYLEKEHWELAEIAWLDTPMLENLFVCSLRADTSLAF